MADPALAFLATVMTQLGVMKVNGHDISISEFVVQNVDQGSFAGRLSNPIRTMYYQTAPRLAPMS